MLHVDLIQSQKSNSFISTFSFPFSFMQEKSSAIYKILDSLILCAGFGKYHLFIIIRMISIINKICHKASDKEDAANCLPVMKSKRKTLARIYEETKIRCSIGIFNIKIEISC